MSPGSLSQASTALAPTTLLWLLAAIALLAAIRAGLHARRRGDAGWRLALLVLGQFALAALLWRVLLPPPVASPALTLVVATAASADVTTGDSERLVRLPEAPAAVGGEAVPDLGSALRRYPQARGLRVLGAGLAARDRDAARGLALAFAPAPLPAGIVELQAPLRIAAGRRWPVAGRVEGGAGQTMELLDPAGVVQARQPLADDGRFALAAGAGPAGRATWQLQRRDPGGTVLETLALPLQVDAGAPLRVLLLAGGVNAETRALRRWALDAGLQLTTQASVGGGVDIGDAPAPPTTARFAAFDVVVLDERSWRTLGAGGRAALRAAVRDGLGVLLRLTADPDATDAAVLKDWGFEVAAADLAREIPLSTQLDIGPPATKADGNGDDDDEAVDPETDTHDDTLAAATDPAPPLTRRPLRLAGADGVVLLRAGDGEPLLLWRALGRGRFALSTLGDTFRLPLAGRRAAYGELWASTLATLARPDHAAVAATPGDARVDRRATFCALAAGAAVSAPDGAVTALAVDPATGAARCAGFWPSAPGWHALHVDADALPQPFFVRGANDAPGLAAAELRAATQALAAHAAAPTSDPGTPLQPGSRWPWFFAWLALAAALWALERAAAGRRRAVVAASP